VCRPPWATTQHQVQPVRQLWTGLATGCGTPLALSSAHPRRIHGETLWQWQVSECLNLQIYHQVAALRHSTGAWHEVTPGVRPQGDLPLSEDRDGIGVRPSSRLVAWAVSSWGTAAIRTSGTVVRIIGPGTAPIRRRMCRRDSG
jgi:hypothetical protein